MKRYRKPKVKPGELRAQWGKLEGNEPDLCYFWGEGIRKCDSHLLHNVLSGPREELNWDAPMGSPPIMWTKNGPSFIKELDERGYDLTTLKFYIRKKAETK